MGTVLGEGMVFLNITDLICSCQILCRQKVISNVFQFHKMGKLITHLFIWWAVFVFAFFARAVNSMKLVHFENWLYSVICTGPSSKCNECFGKVLAEANSINVFVVFLMIILYNASRGIQWRDENLGNNISELWLLLSFVQKLWEETRANHAGTCRPRKLHTERFKPKTFLLWCNSATHCTTVPPPYCINSL